MNRFYYIVSEYQEDTDLKVIGLCCLGGLEGGELFEC